jgi:hypothetical protein
MKDEFFLLTDKICGVIFTFQRGEWLLEIITESLNLFCNCFYYFDGWGYIVAFTKVLTMYQVYHS